MTTHGSYNINDDVYVFNDIINKKKKPLDETTKSCLQEFIHMDKSNVKKKMWKNNRQVQSNQKNTQHNIIQYFSSHITEMIPKEDCI